MNNASITFHKILLAAAIITGFSGITLAGIPVYLGVLCLSAAALVFSRRRVAAPSWLQIALLSTLCLGLLPLAKPDLAAGVREVAQYAAIFGLACTVFAVADESGSRFASRTMAWAGVVLLAGNGLLRILLPGVFTEARLAFILAMTLPFICIELLKLQNGLLLIPVAIAAFVISARNGGLLLCGLLGAAIALSLHEGRRLRSIAMMMLLVLAAFLPQTNAWHTLQPKWSSGGLKRVFIELEATPGAVAEAPLIGHGLGGYKNAIRPFFRRFPEAYDQTIEPDTNSAYALLAVEAGVVPPILLLALLVMTLIQAVRAARRDRNAAALAGAVAVILFGGLFTVTVNRHAGIGVGAVIGMTAGAAVAARTRTKEADEMAAAAGAAGANISPGKLSPPAEAVTGSPLVAQWLPKTALFCEVAILSILLAHSNIIHGKPRKQLEVIGAVEFTDYEYYVVDAREPINTLTGAMKIIDANDAAGNRALAIPAGAGKDGSTAEYTFREIPAGSYFVWVRAFWSDGCSNSIGCIAGGEEMIIAGETYGRWHWECSRRQITLPGGDIRLALRNSEDGVMIDQILLTPDESFSPSGILKPAE